MASNASRGAAAKARTKKWLIARGWQVADLEKVHWIWTPKGRLPIKLDQFGADLLAVNAHAVVFVQVKSGRQAIGTGQFPGAARAFDAFVFPPCAQRWILAWAPRARVPRIIHVITHAGGQHGQEARQHEESQGKARSLRRR